MFSSAGSRFNPPDNQYINQITTGNSSVQNPSSTHLSHSSPLLYLPTNFDFDDGNLLAREYLSQEQEEQIFVSSTSLEAEAQEMTNPGSSNKEARNDGKKKRSSNDASEKSVRRRRTGKKDRHSKIFTSQGLRDRRMRLSLPIARKFFDLQDMLGFDKASKTIEWLFTKSKAAITEFAESLPGVKSSSSATGGKSAASTSESEVVSGVKLTPDNGNNSYAVAEGDSFVRVPREKKSKRLHKQTFNPFNRDQARARARERTRQKMQIKGLDKPQELSSAANPNKLDQLGSFSSLKNGENWGFRSPQTIPPLKMIQEEEYSTHTLQNQMHTISLGDKFLGTITASRPSVFDFSCTLPVRSDAVLEEELMDLSVNWEITNPTDLHRHNTTRNMKPLTGNVHAQNPNAISMTTQYYPQQQNISSTLATTSKAHECINMVQVENASSVFMNILNPNEQSPISVVMTTPEAHSRFRENQFSYNSTVSQKHGTLY